MIPSALLAAALKANGDHQLNPAVLPAIAAVVGLLGELLKYSRDERTDETMSNYTAERIRKALLDTNTTVAAILPPAVPTKG